MQIITADSGVKAEFKEFTVDAALLRELGERLVGKPHVALAELVKNSYDADATEVFITFDDTSITVSDNGDGMSRDEYVDYWLRIGTTHKQEQLETARNRTVTGSKGIGRLAVQFLGDGLELTSRKLGATTFRADVDWDGARKSGDLIKAGAHIAPTKNISFGSGYPHGTSVKITGLKQEWDAPKLKDLARELWFLKPPDRLLDDLDEEDKFDISIEGLPDEALEAFSEQMGKALDNWIATIHGTLRNGRAGGANKVQVCFRDGDKYKAEYKQPGGLLDKASFKIYVFKLSGKQAGGVGVHEAREYFRKFGGIHIYDNGFRLPFYGGDEQDWLQLEIAHSHRLNKSNLLPAELQVQSGLNDLPTNSRIFGIASISTSHERRTASKKNIDSGNYLNVQVTRDRLIDNDAFAELQSCVRWAMDYYAMRSYERRQRTIAAEKLAIPSTDEKISEIREQIFQLSMRVPEPLRQDVVSVSDRFEELESLERQRQEGINAERILLATLATTGMAAIAMEHESGKEISALNEIRYQLTNGSSELRDQKLLGAIDAWAIRSAKVRKLFSPLMNEYDREKRNKYKVKKVIERIVTNSEALLRNVNIDCAGVDGGLVFPVATLAAWNAIFQNVFINSVNAMIDSEEKTICCVSRDYGTTKAVYVLDTGVGVRLHDSDDLFKPFVRRLEIPEERKALGLGGMGIGLTIVKMVSDSLNCEISFVKPFSGYNTAFKIEWDSEEK
ncbi:ATP-binding protein [Pseudomonas sp. BF-B-26]|uniref:ATP-binding protein n=1 Tax=Pseudomonas sp. BF-B-26 TaxID=2832400 RepID=UPI001CBF7AC1|nr:ATP-binding protein [Pseudomonas sp. BF-B-26]